MNTIHKYEIRPYMSCVSMPVGAELLRIAAQGNEAFIWARVDTEAETEPRQFVIYGTGHDIPIEPPLKYVGTFDVGALVFHTFEEVTSSRKERDA